MSQRFSRSEILNAFILQSPRSPLAKFATEPQAVASFWCIFLERGMRFSFSWPRTFPYHSLRQRMYEYSRLNVMGWGAGVAPKLQIKTPSSRLAAAISNCNSNSDCFRSDCNSIRTAIFSQSAERSACQEAGRQFISLSQYERTRPGSNVKVRQVCTTRGRHLAHTGSSGYTV